MKILVRGTNWIGDAVMSIPALRELRRILPDAKITLHTRSWADGLFRDAAFIDDLVTFDPHKWKFKDVLDNSDFLREDRYDLALLFPNSFESALTTYLSKIPQRFGYNKDLRGLLLTEPIAVSVWTRLPTRKAFWKSVFNAGPTWRLSCASRNAVRNCARISLSPKAIESKPEATRNAWAMARSSKCRYRCSAKLSASEKLRFKKFLNGTTSTAFLQKKVGEPRVAPLEKCEHT